MEIDDRAFKMLGKRVYNTQTKKEGYISEIKILSGVGGYILYYNAYYDKFDNEAILSVSDFKAGVLKFVLFKSEPSILFSEEQLDSFNSMMLSEIKEIIGEEFTDDMIVYMTDDEHDEHIRDEKENKIRWIGNDLVRLTELSASVFYDNYQAQALYTKYKEGVISETEMLYGVCNFLCEELKRTKDRELELFVKHEIPGLMKDALELFKDNLNIPPEFLEEGE